MKKVIGFIAALHLVLSLVVVEQAGAQGAGGDILNEVPIWPVPAGMTLEEYTDANRRLGVGMLLMSVPEKAGPDGNMWEQLLWDSSPSLPAPQSSTRKTMSGGKRISRSST